SHKGTFRVYDFSNNVSQASFDFISTIKKMNCNDIKANDTTFFISYNKPFLHETTDIKLSTDELPAVYNDAYLIITSQNQEEGCFSKTFRLGDENIPIHNSINLSIKPNNLPDTLKSKALIAKVESKGRLSSAGGSFVNGFVTTKIRSFGNYAVAVDTIPPTIQATNLSSRNAPGKIKFRIKIKDNLSGINNYRATVNGKWMLMEYDSKTGTLTGETKVEKQNKNHRFALIVSDRKGNKSEYSSEMKY
ncbi:MAG: hypothetical protein JJE25_03240, partial [Bacteroidia bacterium]|nr:hypothetical protein [Bacteroidia bacterium]